MSSTLSPQLILQPVTSLFIVPLSQIQREVVGLPSIVRSKGIRQTGGHVKVIAPTVN